MSENLKPISARIDAQTLDRIEAFCIEKRWWKRNAVINRVLMAVFSDFSEDQIYDMVRRNMFKQEDVTCEYRIEKKPLPY